MTTLTDKKIVDLRQRITPGPWASEAGNVPHYEWDKDNVGVWSHDRLAKSDDEDGDDPMDDAWVCGIWGRLSDEDLANAEAIALVPELLAEVARLRADMAKSTDALRPFYAFGAVLSTAQEENGTAWVTLYDGTTAGNEADNTEPYFESIDDGGCIIGVNASWRKFPGTYCGPVITLADFKKARDVFLANVEIKTASEEESGTK